MLPGTQSAMAAPSSGVLRTGRACHKDARMFPRYGWSLWVERAESRAPSVRMRGPVPFRPPDGLVAKRCLPRQDILPGAPGTLAGPYRRRRGSKIHVDAGVERNEYLSKYRVRTYGFPSNLRNNMQYLT